MEVESLIAKPRKYDTKFPSKEIATQVLRNFTELVSPPEVFIPRRDYSLRNIIEEDIENPNIEMFLNRFSIKAQEEWIQWIQSMDIEELEKLFLSEEEYNNYLELKSETTKFTEEEVDFVRSLENAICSSTPKFTTCKITDFVPTNYSISTEELDKRYRTRELESIGRLKDFDQAPDFSFMDPKKDPDFLNPLSQPHVKKGGYLFKFVSRPYNITFRIIFIFNGVVKNIIMSPANNRDYSSIEDITYFWNEVLSKKYPGATDLKITQITSEDCISFEPDLRLSEGDKPNPTNYKKVDTSSPLGRRLLRSLKENPYHEWSEYSWDFDGEKKVAWIRYVPKFGTFWIYLDRSEIKSKYSNIKVIYPQVTEILDKNINSNKKYITMYNIRVSDYTELPEPFNFMVKSKFSAITSRIEKSGFAFVSKSKHDDFGAIVYSFLRNDLLTNKKRYLERTKDD